MVIIIIFSPKFDDLEAMFSNIESRFDRINELIDKYNRDYINILGRIKEINYGVIFDDTVNDSAWLDKRNFSLNNAAANYSLMYLVYRILNEVKPSNILEFGLGQTTKLTTQYTVRFTHSKLTVIEDNQVWIDNFSRNLVNNKNINIKHAELEEFEYNETDHNIKYKNLDELLPDTKFDFVIVDGPRGWYSINPNVTQNYPRTNILDLVDRLNDEFIIVFDDYDRQGEKNTVEELAKILNKKGIIYTVKRFEGIKHQLVICSEKYNFVTWM